MLHIGWKEHLMNYMKNKYEILKDIPEKNLENKDTTSIKWKKDLIDFFQEKQSFSVLEIGTCYGVTAKVLGDIFDHVDSIEFNKKRLDRAINLCKDNSNINFYLGDAYNDYIYSTLPNKTYDAVVIDCMHLYENVILDINRALTFMDKEKGIYLIFDDYGHPDSPGVNQAVNEAIDAGLKIESYIGEPPGFTVHRTNNTSFTLIHQEGIILSYGK